MNINILEIIWSSGLVVKFILLLLIAASLFSWSIIFLKYSFIKKIKDNNARFYNIYKSVGRFKEVVKQTEGFDFTPYRVLFLSGHSELLKIKAVFQGDGNSATVKSHFSTFGMEIIKRALQKGNVRVNLELEDKLSFLASIGSIAPFVGLFGTVWGIMDSFSALTGGGASLDAIAPGVAAALVTTAAGLAAAIPASWFYNYFISMNSRVNQELEAFEQDFLNSVERSVATIK